MLDETRATSAYLNLTTRTKEQAKRDILIAAMRRIAQSSDARQMRRTAQAALAKVADLA